VKRLAFAALALLAAGCFQPAATTPDAATVRAQVDAAAAPVLRAAHDSELGHRDAALHAGSSHMRLVGYSNGVDDSGDPAHIPASGAFNEIAVSPETAARRFAYLSAGSGDGSFGGFSIIEVTDPAHPHVVSRFAGQGGDDVEVDGDETLAFLGTQRNTPQQLAGGAAGQMDPAAVLARGIYAVDIADKAHPALAGFLPLPYNGPHTMTYVRHGDGNEYLLVCTYDLVADPNTHATAGAVVATQRMVAYRVLRGPGLSFAPVAQYQISEPPPPGRMYVPHDAKVQVHPQTGQTLIYLAYWDKGVRILDFSHPPAAAGGDAASAPMLPEVGAFTDFGPSAYNAIHMAMPFDELRPAAGADGKPSMVHVTVTEPEIVAAPDETGQITFLDTSDPGRPRMLGHWSLPPQQPPLSVSGFDFSPHNFDLWYGKVALAHYHAGVWVVDVSTPENLAHPVEVGFYMPAKPRPDSPRMQPDVWGVKEMGGLLYASDQATGLYVLEYEG
jgi:hypothetical protein